VRDALQKAAVLGTLAPEICNLCLSGMRAKLLKLPLQDAEAMELLADAAARWHENMSRQKSKQYCHGPLFGCVQTRWWSSGHSTRDAFRRLVSRMLAK